MHTGCTKNVSYNLLWCLRFKTFKVKRESVFKDYDEIKFKIRSNFKSLLSPF